MTNNCCPVSLKSVDENIVRVTALVISIFALLYIFTQQTIFIAILSYDFLIRAFRLNRFSISNQIAKFVVNQLKFEKRLTDEAPKRFAMMIGLLMSFLILLFDIFGLKSYAVSITLILFICAAAEALFNYCVGCKIYQILKRL